MTEIPETSPLLPERGEAGHNVDTEHKYIEGLKLWFAVVSLSLACFLVMLDMSIIATAIPVITTEFSSLTDVGWYGSAYLLATSSFQPFTGKLYSTFGSKPTFLTFIGLFELGSLLCGMAPSSTLLILARAVAGLGASGITNGSLTVIAAAVPMHKRPALISIVMFVCQLGMVAGPFIGGVLTEYASWRWCFYINIPIGVICVALLLAVEIPSRLNQSKARDASLISTLLGLDLFGFLWFASFAITFLMALEWGGTVYAWQSATITGLLGAAAGSLLIFLYWEYRQGDNAMYPYSMLGKKVVWSSCLFIFLFQGCALIYSYYLPIYFQAVKGLGPSLSGLYNSPGISVQMLFACISGVLIGKIGYYLPWSVASGAITAVGSGLMSTFTPESSSAEWIGYQVIAGVGRGCGVTTPMVAVQNILPPDQIPLGMSLVAFCQSFGGTLSLTAAQVIFNYSLREGLRRFAPTVDFDTVITAGVSGIRKAVKPEELPGVLDAYNLGITREFYVAAVAAVGFFSVSWIMGWHSVKSKAFTTIE
ncbi:major facilitator superfamily transporter [Trichoderma aethiopicum]